MPLTAPHHFWPHSRRISAQFSQKSTSTTSQSRSQRWQWDSPWESAAEPEGVCSRWNSWTGWIGALKYCKPITCLVVREEDVSAALFLFFFVFLEVSPVFSVVFLVRVTTGHPRFSPESQRLTCVTFSSYVFCFVLFLALHHSLSWLDCTGKTNYDNSLCLTSASYIHFFLSFNRNSLSQYATLNPAYSHTQQ